MKKIFTFVFLFIVIIFFCLWIFNPRIIFERKFEFELPESAEIISKKYTFYNDCLEMRVRFSSAESQVIFEGINAFFDGCTDEGEDYFCFDRVYDKEAEEYICGYDMFAQGIWFGKTREIILLVTRDRNNLEQYYLYVDEY